LGVPRVSSGSLGERVVCLPRVPPWPWTVAGPDLRGFPSATASRGRSREKTTFK
jgi:hypothetical protein